MKEQLELLAKVQSIDTRIIGLSHKEDFFQEEIKKNETSLLSEQQRCGEEKEQLDLLMKRHRDQERDLKALEDQKKKIEDRLLSIKTNKEYQASLAEIENISKQISSREDEILETMDGIEAARAEVKQAEARLKKTEEEFARKKTCLEEDRDAYMADVEDQKKIRDELVPKIDSKLFEDYTKIIKVKAGVAVARVENEQCMGCFMKIPPQVFNEVILGTAMRICPHCQRILYGGEIGQDNSNNGQ